MTQHRVIYIKIIIVISSKFMKQICTKNTFQSTIAEADECEARGRLKWKGSS